MLFRFNPAFMAARTFSMFISPETRHLAWGSNIFTFVFFIFQLVGLLFFFTKQSQKKWTPTSLIVLANPAGLAVVRGTGLGLKYCSNCRSRELAHSIVQG